MTWLRDEVLVAYADNQLSGDDRRAVEQVLAVDPEARHTVALFKLSAIQVRQCLNSFEFGGVPAWFEALLTRTDRSGPHDGDLRKGLKWPKLGVALAACLLLGVTIGHLTPVQPAASAFPNGLAVIGDVPRASMLAEALTHVAQTGAEWTGPDRWRATEIASFRDRFGNECREVEVFTARAGSVPAQVLIACRRALERWTVVGAVANEVMAPSIEAYYVPTEDEARSSLDSILSMLGAQKRISAAERKTLTP